MLCARSSLRCGPCSAKAPQSLPGVQEAALRIRSGLLAQRVPCIRRGYQDLRPCYPAVLPVTPSAGTPASALLGSASIRGAVPVRVTLVPRINVFLRSLLWAVPAQVPEAVFPFRFRPVFAGVWEPEVSQPCPRQSQSSHPPKTASGTNPPLRSGASMVCRLCPPHSPRTRDSKP